MSKRTSNVRHIYINSLSNVSVFEIGDSNTTHGISRAIAVQREKELFFGSEGNFSSFKTFTQPIPIAPIFEPVTMEKTSFHPVINVNRIKITGVSTSSIVHIGSSQNVYLESRVLHIRHLQPRKEFEIGPMA